MEQDLYERLHRLVDKTKIRHRILTSMRFHRGDQLYFSERTFSFRVTPGVSSYRAGHGPPHDVVEILGDTLWYQRGEETAYELKRVDRSRMESQRSYDRTNTGTPSVWSWWQETLTLSPSPQESGTLTAHYIRDVGVPVKRWENGAWTFRTPDETADLSDSWGEGLSHWLDPKGGYEMVALRALHLVHSEVTRDEGAANAALQNWLEEKRRLEHETEGKTGLDHIMPRLW